MKLKFGLFLLALALPVFATDVLPSPRGGAVTYCTCERNPEADWWWPGHDLVLYVIDPVSGAKTRHLLEAALDSLRECKVALPRNPACRRD